MLLRDIKNKELHDLIINTALGELFTEHSGIKTYEALCDHRFLDEDVLWEPFEYYEPEGMLELVDNLIYSLVNFADRVKKL